VGVVKGFALATSLTPNTQSTPPQPRTSNLLQH